MRVSSEVTQRRKEVVLDCLGENPGCTFKVLLAALGERHAEGRWPQADWKYARNDPYDGGLRQLLDQLLRDDRVEKLEVGPDFYPMWSLKRRASVDRIFQLKAEGKSVEEIMEITNLGKSTIYGCLGDPFGAKERVRKRRYCASCGTKKNPEEPWCPKCVGRKAAAMMPPPEESAFWQNAMARASKRGVTFVLGVTPALQRVIRVDTARGRIDRVLAKGEEFEDAARELELL